MLDGGRTASGEVPISQTADNRMATACCFASRMAGVDGDMVLVKVFPVLDVGVAALYCCHCCI